MPLAVMKPLLCGDWSTGATGGAVCDPIFGAKLSLPPICTIIPVTTPCASFTKVSLIGCPLTVKSVSDSAISSDLAASPVACAINFPPSRQRHRHEQSELMYPTQFSKLLLK